MGARGESAGRVVHVPLPVLVALLSVKSQTKALFLQLLHAPGVSSHLTLRARQVRQPVRTRLTFWLGLGVSMSGCEAEGGEEEEETGGGRLATPLAPTPEARGAAR